MDIDADDILATPMPDAGKDVSQSQHALSRVIDESKVEQPAGVAAGVAVITLVVHDIVIATQPQFLPASPTAQRHLGVVGVPLLFVENMTPCASLDITIAPGAAHLMGAGLTIHATLEVCDPARGSWVPVHLAIPPAVTSLDGAPIFMPPIQTGAALTVPAFVQLPKSFKSNLLTPAPMGERQVAVYRMILLLVALPTAAGAAANVVAAAVGVASAPPVPPALSGIFIVRGHTTGSTHCAFPAPECVPGTQLTLEEMRHRISAGPRVRPMRIHHGGPAAAAEPMVEDA